jgi:hypothetical protein
VFRCANFAGRLTLVFEAVVGSAIFGLPVGEHPLQANVVLLVERDHPVVDEIGGGQRRLSVVKAGRSRPWRRCRRRSAGRRVRRLSRSRHRRCPGAAVAGAFGDELAAGLLVGLAQFGHHHAEPVRRRPLRAEAQNLSSSLSGRQRGRWGFLSTPTLPRRLIKDFPAGKSLSPDLAPRVP